MTQKNNWTAFIESLRPNEAFRLNESDFPMLELRPVQTLSSDTFIAVSTIEQSPHAIHLPDEQ